MVSARTGRSGRVSSAPAGGQQPGELHINGVIHGLVELIPDDAALPTYSGDYREKVNGILTELSDEGDIERVAQCRLRSSLNCTDGSSFELRLSGKVTVNKHWVRKG